MKLVIQIPCWNEAEALPRTLSALPTEVPGFDVVEILVIDDGSEDGTARIARKHGASGVVHMPGHQGLARSFEVGILAACARGADVIVNTDADNQYDASYIGALVAPILGGSADIVIGERPIRSLRHFSPLKRWLQRVGSRVVSLVSGVKVGDATSGFRSFSRNAALRMRVFTSFSYTLEMFFQARGSNLRVVGVPIRVNGPTRPSRLFRSNFTYIARSILAVASVYTVYRPAHVFWWPAVLCLSVSLTLSIRYASLAWIGEGRGHLQSVIAAGVMGLAGTVFGISGILAYLLGINRRLLEEISFRCRLQSLQVDDDHSTSDACSLAG